VGTSARLSVAVGLALALILVALVTVVYVSDVPSFESRIDHRLQYLRALPEVAGYQVQGCDVHLSFRRLPDDWALLSREAALRAHRESKRQCTLHVLAYGVQIAEVMADDDSVQRFRRLK